MQNIFLVYRILNECFLRHSSVLVSVALVQYSVLRGRHKNISEFFRFPHINQARNFTEVGVNTRAKVPRQEKIKQIFCLFSCEKGFLSRQVEGKRVFYGELGRLS